MDNVVIILGLDSENQKFTYIGKYENNECDSFQKKRKKEKKDWEHPHL